MPNRRTGLLRDNLRIVHALLVDESQHARPSEISTALVILRLASLEFEFQHCTGVLRELEHLPFGEEKLRRVELEKRSN